MNKTDSNTQKFHPQVIWSKGTALKGNRSKMLRNKVAQEAAQLLYTSQEKEYKQAKQRAAETLGARGLPSNFEVAQELDRIAEEIEGPQRRELLLRMRKEAKEIMETVKEFSPCLVGSVWRGTARKNSDIDVHVFCQDHIQVVEKLQKQNYKIGSSELRSVTKAGNKESSFHIHVILQSRDGVEIVVRSPEHLGQEERCETYGDVKAGLNLNQLARTLKENPLQKFVPT
ncbi:MAG: nucleotidyltransferase domain-containing protein [Candidatus Bathyarchaeota archaeon]|nr:nucleotidyltransferase domain-containing protein [Candidatus Bathyarchaeum sp.]